MCVVSSDKSKYEVILATLDDDPICAINFVSITNVCRFLQQVNFSHVRCHVIRTSDLSILDLDLLMEVWKGVKCNAVQN